MASADAVLLIAFGGPTRPEEIRPFLENVTRGRRIPPERLDEVAHHYELIGGRSPLNQLTFRQAEALRRTPGTPPVYVGMRNWEPYLAETLARMALDGARRATGVILAPHASESSRERYMETVEEGRAALGPRAPAVSYVHSWHEHPLFVEAVAERVREARATLPEARRAGAVLVFTAHSIPVAAAEQSPYVAEIEASARAVALRLDQTRWEIAYQSRSGNPRDPWLEPDINAALERLAGEGARAVVVEPIGFVCDHVEVLYDLDVEARATAARHGLAWARAGTVNDHPLFIRMLAEVVRDHAA
jgi:protoporphyrin/coproporphyrin ferrochelatase